MMKHMFFAIIIVVSISWAVSIPYSHFDSTCADFAAGETVFVDIIPYPDSMGDCAITISANDTIRILQLYPNGHCQSCIADEVYGYMHDGSPPLNIKFELKQFADESTWVWWPLPGHWEIEPQFCSVSSIWETFEVMDEHGTVLPEEKCMMDYHIMFFGVADRFGSGLTNDLTTNVRNALENYAETGRGVVLTHDTIRDIMVGMFLRQHTNFNSMTDYTGLTTETVVWDSASLMYTQVHRAGSADPAAPIINFPFHLPDTFDVTRCHKSGEVLIDGDIWYRGRGGAIYMHSYHNPELNSYFSFFSTGHQETSDGSSFTTTEWETKAMINAIFYAFYGGRGNGIYTSAPIDAGCVTHMDSIVVAAELPGSSYVIIEIRISDDGIVWDDWVEIPGSGMLLPPEVSNSQYFQYRISLCWGVGAAYGPIVPWIGLFGTQDIPEVVLLSPSMGAVTACSCGVVKFLVLPGSPLDIDGCEILYDGVTYGAENLSLVGDTLVFTPPNCFTHGEYHEGWVQILRNEDGCLNEPELPFSFDVDLLPPEYIVIQPSSGDTVGPNPVIIASITDDGIGLNEESIEFTINGIPFGIHSPGVDFTDDTLRIYTLGLGLDLGENVEICIFASDMVSDLLCGPNSSDTCWTFFVDTLPPEYEMLSPLLTACDSLSLLWWIWDPAGIDTTSLSIGVDAADFYYPTGMIFDGDTLYFNPGIALTDGETLLVAMNILQDIFGNTAETELYEIVVDQSPPLLTTFPAAGDTVMHFLPVETLCVWDEIAGLDTASIWFSADGITYYIGAGLTPISPGSCFTWQATDTLYDGDSLHLCFHADDLVPEDACGPNILDTCWNIYISLPGPIADIIEPDEGVFTSCSTQAITATIFGAGAPLVEDSIFVVFNGDTIGVDDTRLEFHDDSLVFTPMTSYTDGETVYYEILRASNEHGSTSEHLDSVWFIVDLSPPLLWSSIADGDTITNPMILISFTSHDSGCGVAGCSLWINDDFYERETCDAFDFNPDDYGLCFWENTFHTIEFMAFDCAQYCGANEAKLQIDFFVPDDDTIAPYAFLTAPQAWTADSVFIFTITLNDTSSIYAPIDPSDTQDAHILWDTDSELVIDAEYAELHIDSVQIDANGDTIIYMHSDTIPGQPAGSQIVWQAFFWDNDFDCQRPDDRIPGYTEIDSVAFIRRPHMELIYPPDGVYTSCIDLDIKILIASEDPVVMSSLVFTVAAETLGFSDSRVYAIADTLIITPPPVGYMEGEVVIEFIEGQTTLGYQLEPDIWSFFVDITPPDVEFIYPSDWEMLPEPVFTAIALASDELAGVDTLSAIAYFVVEAETLDAQPSVESYGGDWRVRIPSVVEISPADSVLIALYICDDVEIVCDSNCAWSQVSFWIEPNFPCSLSTNPITPNSDGYNDKVMFYYPKPYSTSVRLCIYDLGGREMFCRDISGGDMKGMTWDGTRKGKKLPAGTYLYIISRDGEPYCRGTITVAR